MPSDAADRPLTPEHAGSATSPVMADRSARGETIEPPSICLVISIAVALSFPGGVDRVAAVEPCQPSDAPQFRCWLLPDTR